MEESRKKDNFDLLYVSWGEGPAFYGAKHIKVYDKSILLAMSGGANPSGSSSRSDMVRIFKFAANAFDNQEWGLYYNKDSYELTTKGSASEVGTSLDGVTWKVHSHPNEPANDRAEIESMGYWTFDNSAYDNNGKLLNRDAAWYPANSYPNDVVNYRNDGMPTSYVYFPNSGYVYRMTNQKLPYKTIIK